MVKIKEFIKSRIDIVRSFFAANPQRAKFIGIIAIAVILPLTVGVALTIQNLSQRASQGVGVEIVDKDGIPISTTTDPNVFLKITLPADWVFLPSAPQSNNIFVQQAFAQNAAKPGYVLCGSGLKCENNIKVDTPDKEGFNKCLSNKNFSGADKINGKYLTRCNSDLYYFDVNNNNECSLVPGSNPSETTCTPPQPPTPEDYDYAFCGSGLKCNGAIVDATDCGEAGKAKCLSTTATFSRDQITGRSLACCNATKYDLINNNCTLTLAADAQFSDPKCSIPIAATANTSTPTFTPAPVSESTPPTVISPNGGEKWIVGNTYDIEWKASAVGRVYIYLYDYSGPVGTRGVADNIPVSDGKYSWKIPSEITPSEKLKIAVRDTMAQEKTYDLSDEYFSIVASTTPSSGTPTPTPTPILTPTSTAPISPATSPTTHVLEKLRLTGGLSEEYYDTVISSDEWNQKLIKVTLKGLQPSENSALRKVFVSFFSADGFSQGFEAGVTLVSSTVPPVSSTVNSIPKSIYDLNVDGVVNCKDSKIASDQFGKEGANIPTELLSQTGKVDGTTLNAILRNYTPGDTTVCN